MIAECATYGSEIYLDPYTYFEEVISGCVLCKKGFYTNGQQCLPYSFTSMGNCSGFH